VNDVSIVVEHQSDIADVDGVGEGGAEEAAREEAAREATDAPQCSICQDALAGDLAVHSLDCGHSLHRACIEGMLPNGSAMFKCPLCNLPIENWDGEQPPDRMPSFATGETDSLGAPTDVVQQDAAGNDLDADGDVEDSADDEDDDSAESDYVPGE
jgi:hypothetical protein